MIAMVNPRGREGPRPVESASSPGKPDSNVPALIVVPIAQYWRISTPQVKTEPRQRAEDRVDAVCENAERSRAKARASGSAIRRPKPLG